MKLGLISSQGEFIPTTWAQFWKMFCRLNDISNYVFYETMDNPVIANNAYVL